MPHPNVKMIDPIERSLTLDEINKRYKRKDFASIQPVIFYAPAVSYEMKSKLIFPYTTLNYISYFRWIDNQYQLISTACDFGGVKYGDILLRFTVKDDDSKIYLYSYKHKAFYPGMELKDEMFSK